MPSHASAPPSTSEPVRIGLALGGGAVRGAAHIGVLEVLDAAGLGPVVVTGTSAGALVGGLYAAGLKPDGISALAGSLHWKRLVRPTIGRRSLFTTRGLGAFLDEAFGGRSIGALDRTFAAVACDLSTAESVVLRQGPASTAVLASAAIPGIFPPVQRDGRLLIDGGLVDLVPAALARALGADVVVAVDVTGPLPRRAPRNLIEILVAASTLQPGVGERLRHDADLVLAPAVDEYAFWELSRIPEFTEAGRVAAERALPVLRALVAVIQERRKWEHRLAPSRTVGRATG
jgi:NTE family protein